MKRVNIALVLFLISWSFSYGQNILVRPNTSVGYLHADDIDGLVISYGVKIHLAANDFQRYGLLVDHLFVPDDKDVSYLRTGLMIEQVLFKYFNMGIGTIGYINLVQTGENPFGIYTHLGFEYKIKKNIGFLASFQSDFIFRKRFTMFSAFQAGLNIYF
jgi:hypothetical protein